MRVFRQAKNAPGRAGERRTALTAKAPRTPRKVIFNHEGHEEHEGRKIDRFKKQKTFLCILQNSFFLRVNAFVFTASW
jgi:hypothetical protein